MRKAVYYADTLIYPTVALGLATLTFAGWSWLAQAAFGFVLFTFIEYWVHRTLLHRFFYHGTHEEHHKHPADFVVLWYVPLLFLGFYLVMPVSLFCGFTLGYCWFIVAHHVMHHTDLVRHRWIGAYAEWHLMHHKFIRCNFGITHPFWDMAFGTYKTTTR